MKDTPIIDPLRTKLLILMVFRVVLAIAFLGVITWFQFRGSFVKADYLPIHMLVAVVGFLTIAYAVLLNFWIKNYRIFTYLQVSVDIVLITAIVYVTGGIESYLSSIYFISIIGSSMLLGRRGGFYVASLASIVYGVMIDLDFYYVLPEEYKLLWSPVDPDWEDVLTTIITHMLAFYTIAFLVGYLTEKTARMERALEEKEIDFDKLEALNKHIVENIPTGILTLDSSYKVTSFNVAAEDMTGYSLREVYYRDLDEIFPGMIDGWESESRQKRPRVESLFSSKEGEDIHIGYSISEGTGGEMAHIVIFMDLTLLKAMEEELRRDDRLKALGHLSASIAHEIRNPLASISGSIQMLKEELDLKGDKLHLMEIVLRETERLNFLITDFLLFAKPAQDKNESVDIGSLLSETIEVFSNSIEARGIEIKSALSEGAYVDGNKRQLAQIFWNLFLNASNAMDGDGVLSVNVKFADKVTDDGGEDQAVVVEVTDNGPGIDKENITKIFDPFFSTKDFGTGLGLSIVHRVVESHGGVIDVSSVSGEGSTFVVTLPLLVSDREDDVAVGGE